MLRKSSLGIVGIVGVVLFLSTGILAGCGAKMASQPSKDSYYSVMLTNNSIFFARIKGEDDRYLYLTDIYYLQRTAPQPATGGKEGQPDQPGGLTLVRQASDVQGPKDEMVLNREHLLYYQELREDSNIVKGIHQKAELAAKAPVPAAAAPAAQPPATAPKK